MNPQHLYNKWLLLFINNGIPFEIDDYDIIKFDSYEIYTPNTYKFNFNLGLTNSGIIYKYGFKTSDYKLFADLFFIDGWREELEYQLNLENIDQIWRNHPKYSRNYSEISYYVKPWVDYVTFQGYRTIVQFRLDKYLRKEKLLKINGEKIY